MLADILRATDLGAELFFRASLAAPFAIEVPGEPGRIRFHVAGEGRAWIGLDSGESVTLEPGDLALIPHGLPHVIADSERSARDGTERLADVLASAEPSAPGTLVYGGCGARSVVVCGQFECSGPGVHPIFQSLPPLIHRPREEPGDFVWLDRLLEHLAAEAAARRPGCVAVAQRLAEIIFIEVLRRVLEATDHDGAGLGALADPPVRRTIEAIHENPAAPFTLDLLARRAGVSRSVLTERFRERLGCSPMRYVARWRLTRAAELLRAPERSVGEIARAVGYSSESAFSRAFRDFHGVPPGRLRGTTRISARA